LGFSLQMVNVWIGLCKGVAGLPRDVTLLGYQDKLIEWRFRTDTGELVCPDLIVASKEVGHCLLLEFKGGENASEDQLHRYAGVTRDALQQLAFLQPEETLTHDTVIVGAAEHGKRLKLAIVQSECAFPLVLAHSQSLRLAANSIGEARTDVIFRKGGLRIDFSTAPMSFVPFDSESEDWEVANAVAPVLLEFMCMRRPRIAVDEICEQVFVLVWGAMGEPAKDNARSKIRSVLLMLADEAFSEFIRCGSSKHFEAVDVVKNPVDFRPDRRTAAFQKLQRSLAEFVESIRTGVRKVEGVQMSFDFEAQSSSETE